MRVLRGTEINRIGLGTGKEIGMKSDGDIDVGGDRDIGIEIRTEMKKGETANQAGHGYTFRHAQK